MSFNFILNQQLDVNIDLVDQANKQKTVDDMYYQLTNAIKFAYDSCSSYSTINKLKEKRWFTKELRLFK